MEKSVNVLNGMSDLLWECTAVDSAHGDAESVRLEDIMVGEGLLAVVGGLSGLNSGDVKAAARRGCHGLLRESTESAER